MESTRDHVFRMLDGNPDVTTKAIVEELHVKAGLIRSLKYRWKQLRGYEIGTKKHPIFKSIKIEKSPDTQSDRHEVGDQSSVSNIETLTGNVSRVTGGFVKLLEDNRRLKVQLELWEKRAGELNDTLDAALRR